MKRKKKKRERPSIFAASHTFNLLIRKLVNKKNEATKSGRKRRENNDSRRKKEVWYAMSEYAMRDFEKE